MAGSEGNLIAVLSTLESKTVDRDDKIEAYSTLCNNLKDDELSLFGLDVTKNAKRVLAVLRRDITTEWDSVVQGALQVLGFSLHDVDIVRTITESEGKLIVGELCQCTEKTVDKTTCTRALWCLNKQCLPAHIVGTQVPTILTAVEHALDHWRMQSITVEHEALHTLSRLQEQVPVELRGYTVRWGKLVYPLLIHSAAKIRERALVVMETGLFNFKDNQGEMAQSLLVDFKSKMVGELTKLFNSRNELYVLTVWSLVVQLLGEELHHGGLINQILPLAELGFKSASVQVKCAAFQAWQQLIDNFALNAAILGDVKRVKLIMQVFKINNAKVEEVALKKLDVWWHFVQKLGPKVSVYFDQVCVPLMQMCVGSNKLSGNVAQNIATPTFSRIGMLSTGTSPVTPRLNLTNPGTQLITFSSVQLRGCQILAHILGQIPADLDVPRATYTVEPLPFDVMTGPAFFIKQSPIILSCAKELISNQGRHMSDGLLYHIWYSLVAHVKNAVESGAKSESRDVLTSLLNYFQLMVLGETLDNNNILRMFQAVCCLPRKALCSTAYQMGGGEVLHGTPILFLTELLLTPKLMEACTSDEKYMSLFGMVIEIGFSNYTSVLEFCQVILQDLGRHSEFVSGSDQLWRMWSIVVNPLLEHIRKTNEVNQGDVLEHDFTCMYTALLFPVNKLLTGNLSQPTMKTLLKTWSELYGTFARLSAMVTNVEANISCEDLSHRMRSAVDLQNNKEVVYVECLVQMLEAVVSKVDFSSIGAPRNFTAPLSPSRWMKRKQKPMENLHTCVLLLSDLMTHLQEVTGAGDKTAGIFMGKQKTSHNTAVQSTASGIVGILTVLFTHVTSSHIIENMINSLATPIAKLFQAAGQKSGSMYPATFQQKLEKFWLDLVTCLQSRYTGGFDSDFLAQLSPLLEVTFNHTRRQIKTQTVLLWNATFSKSALLVYPETLRPVLVRVKEKTPLLLPGWISTDVPVIEETPVSQFSQIGSSAPEPRLPGMPSPHKIRGSFLNKEVSPNVKKSPARSPVSKLERRPASESKVKKNLSLSDMRDDDFVVIAASPTKKRPLTEHQKDVMRQRRSLPAMYNNLELSQDVSMASQFMTDTQHEKQSQSDSVIILDMSEKDSSFTLPDSQADGVKMLGKNKEDTYTRPSERLKKPDKFDLHMPKRRRSIRFSDEVQEESNVITSGQRETTMNIVDEQVPNVTPASKCMGTEKPANEGLSFIDLSADESANDGQGFFDCLSEVHTCGESGQYRNLETRNNSEEFSMSDKVPSSGSQQPQVSLKQNLLDAMGGFVSDISSSSGKSAFSSVESEKSNPDRNSCEVTPQKISTRWSNSRRSFSNSLDVEDGRKSKSCPLRKSFSFDSGDNGRTSVEEEKSGLKKTLEDNPVLESSQVPPVSLESIVEDTQDMISPTKSPDISASDFEYVMETPVKSMTDEGAGVGETRTPTSRALFERENSKDSCPISPTLEESKKSPIIKLRRLTSTDILKYSPHRDRPSDKDDLVRTCSQPDPQNQQAIKVAKVRRSLSQPEEGKFGGKLLKSDKSENIVKPAQDSEEKLSRSTADVSTETVSNQDKNHSTGKSLDSQLSQGFVPAQTPDKSQSILGNIDNASQILIEDDEMDSNLGQASLPLWNIPMGRSNPDNSFQDSITSSIENLETTKWPPVASSSYNPDDCSTLKNSTDLFSELSPTAGSDSGETLQSDFANLSPVPSDSDKSYDPDITYTMATSSEMRTRRKQQAPKRSPDLPRDRRRSRASKPSSAKDADENRKASSSKEGKDQGAEAMPSRKRGRPPKRSQAVDPENVADSLERKDPPLEILSQEGIVAKTTKQRTRRSFLGSLEEPDKSTDSHESTVRKSGRTPKSSTNSDVKRPYVDNPDKDPDVTERTAAGSEPSNISNGDLTVPVDNDRIGVRTRKRGGATKTAQEVPGGKIENSSIDNMALMEGVQLSKTVSQSVEENLTSANEKRGRKRCWESEGNVIVKELHQGLDGEGDEYKTGWDKDGTVFHTFSDDEEVTFKSKEEVQLQAGGRKVKIVRTTEEPAKVKDVETSQDMTPDTRDNSNMHENDPVRQSTSQVKKQQSQKNSLKLHENAPKARKSLTPSVDPPDSDSAEDEPLINLTFSTKTEDSRESVTKIKNTEEDMGDVLTHDCIEEAGNEVTQEEVLTPSRKPSKYKVAKTSPVSLRLRSAQKTLRSGPLEKADSLTASGKKPKHLSFGCKKLEMADEKVVATVEVENVDYKFKMKTVIEVDEKLNEEGKSAEKQIQVNNSVVEKLSVTTKESVSKENEVKAFTEIRQPIERMVKLSFSEPEPNNENIDTNSGGSSGIAVLETPKSSERIKPKLLVGKHSDSKLLHRPKRLSYPLTERSMCKTSPRGILKHSPVGKLGFFSGVSKRSFQRSGSPKSLFARKFHPVKVNCLYSPSASPSASILKRRRLSGDIASNSPSPPAKHRRVSFAEPISVSEDPPISPSRTSQVNRCLTLPAPTGQPASPLTTCLPAKEVPSQDKVSSQSQASCASTQESQLNCTDPVYPDLKQCKTPVEDVLAQLTSSIWSRGLGQLIRSRNIRTVGDLSNLSEYEVHNLPIRSPKVPTLRKVLKKFEAQQEKKKAGFCTTTSPDGSGGTVATATITMVTIDKMDCSTEDQEKSNTPPGSPKKTTQQTQSQSMLNPIEEKELNSPSSLASKSTLGIDVEVVDKSAAATTAGASVVAAEEDEVFFKVPDSSGLSDLTEDDVLPAMEDALSELSPEKGQLDMNASIELVTDDDELDVLIGLSSSTSTNQIMATKSTVQSEQGSGASETSESSFGTSVSVDQANIMVDIRTLEAMIEKYSCMSTCEMQQFRLRDIMKFHSHSLSLTNLVSTMWTSKCSSPGSQEGKVDNN